MSAERMSQAGKPIPPAGLTGPIGKLLVGVLQLLFVCLAVWPAPPETSRAKSGPGPVMR